MALLRMMSTVNPISGASVVGGSTFVVYNTDNIIWGTLASKTGTTASSVFQYSNANGTTGQARVKAAVTTILASAGAVTIPST
jgi:hypothetical protein